MSPVTAPPEVRVRPQPGPQWLFTETGADIAVYGGAAGGGKTFALLMEPKRWMHVPGFSAVYFRRTYPQMTAAGSAWEEAEQLYPLLGGRSSDMDWYFPPHGNVVQFRHMEHEKTKYDWHGSQVPLFLFDEASQFSESQIFYMLSRNRSACGVAPYVRMGSNADADSWLVTDRAGEWGRGFISWWIDPETGYAIPERAGRLRWFVRPGETLEWADSVAELAAAGHRVLDEEGTLLAKSVTFVPARVHDNRILLAKDPGYLANLHALPPVERARLLGDYHRGGNWKIKPAAGLVFNEAWFLPAITEVPSDVVAWVRYWDKAGTPGGGAYTVGVLMGLVARGFVVVTDVVRGQWGAADRERVILQTAADDGPNVAIRVEQEPGSGGKESAEATCAMLFGYDVRADRPVASKGERAGRFSAAAEQGRVKILAGPWNREWLAELHRFDPLSATGRKDQVDASTGAFNALASLVVDPGDPEDEIYGRSPGSSEQQAAAQEMGGGGDWFGETNPGARWGPRW